jgi:hypothetical protein
MSVLEAGCLAASAVRPSNRLGQLRPAGPGS